MPLASGFSVVLTSQMFLDYEARLRLHGYHSSGVFYMSLERHHSIA